MGTVTIIRAHVPVEQPGWATKIKCSCGGEFATRLSFKQHQEAAVTTIRAHVPEKTLAGLMVALPPDIKPPFWPVFDLAVPCPTCDGVGFVVDDRGVTYEDTCFDNQCDSGWVLHGRYRVLTVAPCTEQPDADTVFPYAWRSPTGHWWLMLAEGSWQIVLPAAAPGGVALIVEAT